MRLRLSFASGFEGVMTLKKSSHDAPIPTKRILTQPRIVADLIRTLLGDRIGRHETFWLLTLTSKAALIAAHEVSVGGLAATVIDPRLILRRALNDNAASLIISHNHPSNDPSPSHEDIQVTQRLADACLAVGCKMLDHVIVTADGFWSWAEK